MFSSFLDVLIKINLIYRALLLLHIISVKFSNIILVFAYRNSILQADQKSYIISNYGSVFNIIKVVSQIIVLVLFHNFTVYLLTEMLCTICKMFVWHIE